jgi:hypothetical protein
LAALEIAKIYRLQGKLEQARGREEDAVRWLKDMEVQRAEQQNAWALDVSRVRQVRLGPLAEKQCYVELELAVTRFLQGDESQAAATVPAMFEKCSSRRPELMDILSWQLRMLGSESREKTIRDQSDKFVQRFLGSGK